MDALLSPHGEKFVVIHGLGGVGKTALARAAAQRVAWHYDDRVLGYSFETFAAAWKRVGSRSIPSLCPASTTASAPSTRSIQPNMK